MILSLVVALLQTAPASSGDARPVRVWLGSSGGLVRGASVRVYVQTTRDGNLIVLHRRTDGRIDVLFPGKPSEDVFVRAGTYEIQATSDHVAFVVAEPDGSGLVLAALAPRAYRFDEFVRAAAWNPEALAPAWNGSDGDRAADVRGAAGHRRPPPLPGVPDVHGLHVHRISGELLRVRV